MSVFLLALTASASPRIVNGTEAAIDQYPEVVGVLVDNSGTCTGSLIHPEWILTAAHCFDSIDVEETPSANTRVMFGNSMSNPTLEVPADLVIVHEMYVGNVGEAPMNGLGPYNTLDDYDAMTNDIALIHLSEPVLQTPMGLNVAPIDDDWLTRPVTEIGFGITAPDAGDSGTKRYVDAPRVNSYTEAHPDGNGSITYYDQGGQGTCQGDSGGPTVYKQGEGYAQISITSYGPQDCTYGTDMRVDLYIDWIEEQAEIEVIRAYLRPPTFRCSHQLNPGSLSSIAIGVAPVDLQCAVNSGDPETVEQVTWYWGDGSDPEVVEGLSASHVYQEQGVYNLQGCIAGTRQELPYEDCILRASHVNVCETPVASFEVTPLEGLRLGVDNTTSLRAHNCVSNAQWEVYQGAEIAGEPLFSVTGWAPEFDLGETGPGTYTVVLNVGGLAGTGAAVAQVEVGRGGGCSTSPVMPGLFGLMLVPLAGLRRRS